jgi:protein HOOK3
MPDTRHDDEIAAFFSFFSTFDLTRPATTVSDLSDGSTFAKVLSLV